MENVARLSSRTHETLGVALSRLRSEGPGEVQKNASVAGFELAGKVVVPRELEIEVVDVEAAADTEILGDVLLGEKIRGLQAATLLIELEPEGLHLEVQGQLVQDVVAPAERDGRHGQSAAVVVAPFGSGQEAGADGSQTDIANV